MFIEDKKDKVFIPQTENTITANDYNQIKNEIQEAIELAGMTPEKDVIQFPQALKMLTQQSGAEEVSKIKAAGAEQLQIVNTAGSTQAAAVYAAGQTQLNTINTAGVQAVQDAQTAANTATAKAVEAADSASAAASSVSSASRSANTATTQATNAADSATAAAQSASAASTSADTASGKAEEASQSASLAQQWAVQTESEVEAGQGYGAKKYAQDAASSATVAAGSASAAAASAQTCEELVRQVGDPAKKDLSNVTSIAASSAVQTALNAKANKDLSNGTKATQESINNIMPNTMDYVVESYSDASGNWYRKHKSGWVEQGGICAGSGGTISLLTPFSGTDYLVMGNVRLTYQRGGSGDGGGAILCYPNSASSFYMTFAARNFGDIGQQKVSWIACGQGA